MINGEIDCIAKYFQEAHAIGTYTSGIAPLLIYWTAINRIKHNWALDYVGDKFVEKYVSQIPGDQKKKNTILKEIVDTFKDRGIIRFFSSNIIKNRNIKEIPKYESEDTRDYASILSKEDSTSEEIILSLLRIVRIIRNNYEHHGSDVDDPHEKINAEFVVHVIISYFLKVNNKNPL
jgi:hypothetical protein